MITFPRIKVAIFFIFRIQIGGKTSEIKRTAVREIDIMGPQLKDPLKPLGRPIEGPLEAIWNITALFY